MHHTPAVSHFPNDAALPKGIMLLHNLYPHPCVTHLISKHHCISLLHSSVKNDTDWPGGSTITAQNKMTCLLLIGPDGDFIFVGDDICTVTLCDVVVGV